MPRSWRKGWDALTILMACTSIACTSRHMRWSRQISSGESRGPRTMILDDCRYLNAKLVVGGTSHPDSRALPVNASWRPRTTSRT
eukprot:4994660-Heterocapsa_arctica.AAC.1